MLQYGYIIYYTKNNSFYHNDIISSLIKNGLSKCFQPIFINYENNDESYLYIDDIKAKEVSIKFEVRCPEYYKFYYSDDIIIYINEYNMIICSINRLDKDNIENIILQPQYIFIH